MVTMNNIERIKNSLDFIETNLMEKLSLEEIARAVFFSSYHFHRMFRAVTGYTVKSYIRRRRLSQAAREIEASKESLADIAVKYQFESQQSFSTAFKQMFRMSPGKLRKERSDYTPFGRMIVKKLDLTKPGGITMEPRIIKIEGFYVIGMECHTKQSIVMSEESPLKKMWADFRTARDGIQGIVNEDQIMAFYDYDPEEMAEEDISYTYTVGVKVKNLDNIPETMVGKTIPASDYLVFEHDDSKGSLADTYDYIDEKWIPQSDYRLSENPDYEVHSLDKNNQIVELHISVQS